MQCCFLIVIFIETIVDLYAVVRNNTKEVLCDFYSLLSVITFYKLKYNITTILNLVTYLINISFFFFGVTLLPRCVPSALVEAQVSGSHFTIELGFLALPAPG